MKPFLLLLIPMLTVSLFSSEDSSPWPAPVADHEAVAPGEHPRLFFRQADLPALRARAETPEGQAIIERLRELLGGGEAMPEAYRPIDAPFGDRTPPIDLPEGAYTMSHAAGFGLLYQLTGEQKYADLGAESFRWAFEGIRDRDRTGRYGWKERTGNLRAGPVLGWYAVAYDLLYDGLDEDFRIEVAQAIQNFDQGGSTTLSNLAGGASHHPFSNHWGMQVGGAALALLAIKGDPGVDDEKIAPLLEESQEAMIRVMTEGFGDGGFFAEGDGPGTMASHIVFLPALQAWRTAGGQDFLTPRPHAQWMAKRWMFLAHMQDGEIDFRPKRGGYPHNVWARDTLSGGGYFAYGFGVLEESLQPGLHWMYNEWLKEADKERGTPFDTVSPYPHTAVLAFINFPLESEPEDPNEVWPRRNRDRDHDFYAWRNRFQDENDVIISVLGKTTPGYIKAEAESAVSILTGGELIEWAPFSDGIAEEYDIREHGGSVLQFGDGESFAVDFSGTSGRDVLLVRTTREAPEEGESLRLGEQYLDFLFLGDGETPTVELRDDQVHAGEQVITLTDEGRLSLRH
ncbi:MAG: DUF4962 domain-containing protein [Opitutales bacterium]|nr:DUF4962 domain-containing protein [Opitutales bacterium]